jgi:nucleoside-diphosphate-sugar epimerase
MKDILIIGGTRFFGHHLAQLLVEDGHQVTRFHRGPDREVSYIDGVTSLHGDRTDRESLQSALGTQKWDIVFDQVCYTAPQAKLACEVFRGRTDRYIVTSSQSVYDYGEEQPESNFDAQNYPCLELVDEASNYQEAKRKMESIFSRQNEFAVAIARPSLVLGVDDYTQRLRWHLERIRNGLPIYFPNLQIRTDFITARQAGLALMLIGLSNIGGPVNVTTPGSIEMTAFLSMCERAVGGSVVLAKRESSDDHSPYGGDLTKTMTTKKLQSLGFNAAASIEWLPELISEIAMQLK